MNDLGGTLKNKNNMTTEATVKNHGMKIINNNGGELIYNMGPVA